MAKFTRPNRSPDLEVELHLLPTSQGGLRRPMCSGRRVPHDFGLPDEMNDGMYEFPDGGALEPGGTGRAFVWLLAPEQNAGRFAPGFTFRIWEVRWVGRGKIVRVLNADLVAQGRS